MMKSFEDNDFTISRKIIAEKMIESDRVFAEKSQQKMIINNKSVFTGQRRFALDDFLSTHIKNAQKDGDVTKGEHIVVYIAQCLK
ncbi:hypothetical protein [Escherichia coli]|uniref:hypothetical protein n=1 Tax=Escherichia coli TaxID=562 RepID=UPI000A671460|nr:hypothetical protein [Escherichia coli]